MEVRNRGEAIERVRERERSVAEELDCGLEFEDQVKGKEKGLLVKLRDYTIVD